MASKRGCPKCKQKIDKKIFTWLNASNMLRIKRSYVCDCGANLALLFDSPLMRGLYD